MSGFVLFYVSSPSIRNDKMLSSLSMLSWAIVAVIGNLNDFTLDIKPLDRICSAYGLLLSLEEFVTSRCIILLVKRQRGNIKSILYI